MSKVPGTQVQDSSYMMIFSLSRSRKGMTGVNAFADVKDRDDSAGQIRISQKRASLVREMSWRLTITSLEHLPKECHSFGRVDS